MPNIPLARIFSPVNHKNFRFLILDCPTDSTLPVYLQELKNRGVTDVVRVCEPTYKKELLVSNGIQVHDWPFPDGGVPPKQVVHGWLSLVDERFGNVPEPPKDAKPGQNQGPTIAVHCVAGLGRAPVLVAIALIEAGMSPLDAVEYVRKFRRGAFNSVQIGYLFVLHLCFSFIII
ncbi:protein tyrosine phosphatase type IVA, member 1 [Hyaloraphidium curvatum]|nr:protein tyrosine phosphatase type IVA, member 1 [Hyaloraphidium curvatum]